jgi:ribosome-binding ATPase YchF (GTP1/OBG family)
MKTYLNQGKLAYDMKSELNEKELELLKPYNFLTFKPFVYAINVTETDLKNAAALKAEFEEKLQRPVSIVSAKFESEIMEMDAEDREMFLEDLKDGKDVVLPTLDDLIKLAFDTVGLMYYFTTGKKETRAWTIPLNSTAPQAA